MDKLTLHIEIHKSDKNYCCGYGHPALGAIAVTGNSIEDTQCKFKESLAKHIIGCVDDGDVIPDEFTLGNYDILFE